MRINIVFILFIISLFLISGCGDKKSTNLDNLKNKDKINYNVGVSPEIVENIINESSRHDRNFNRAYKEVNYLKTNINAIDESELEGVWDYLIERFQYIESRDIAEYVSKTEEFTYMLQDYELFLLNDDSLLRQIYPNRNPTEELSRIHALLAEYKTLKDQLINLVGEERYKATASVSGYIYYENFCDNSDGFICIKDNKEELSRLRRKLPTNVQFYVDPKRRWIISTSEPYSGLIPLENYLDKAILAKISSESSNIPADATKYVNPKTGIIHYSNPDGTLVPLEEYKEKHDPSKYEERTDIDRDLLIDQWEIEYFGSISIYGPNDNPDGDKYSNIEEYLIDTDPTQPSTNLKEGNSA